MSEMPEERDQDEGNSIDLIEIAMVLVRGWAIILCFGIAGFAIGIYQLHSAAYIYRTEMRVMPVDTSTSSSSSQLGSLSGLASLAGVKLPANSTAPQFQLFIESLHSRDVANELAKNPYIMHRLYRAELNPQTGSWQERTSRLQSIENSFYSMLGMRVPAWEPPDGARLQQFLASRVVVDEDEKRPYIVSLDYDSTDPKFAATLLTALSQSADAHLRQKALLHAKQYIDYLSNQLQNVTVAEHRQAIMQTLSEQEKFAMMANSAAPFAAEVFDSPFSSINPISPNPFRVLLTAIAIGAGVGALLIYAFHRFGYKLRSFV